MNQSTDNSLQSYRSHLGKDYLELAEGGDLSTNEIKNLRHKAMEALGGERFKDLRESFTKVPNIICKTRFDQPEVCIDLYNDKDDRSDLPDSVKKDILSALIALRPWKKGPFQILDHHIDAEWRSDLKWQRIEPHLLPLQGKTVCDIGCNNGYFMYRMANHDPKRVIGLEPVHKHWFAFHLMQKLAQTPNLFFELLGVEHINLFESYFDTIFCLGILYHHTDPVGCLRKIKTSMKPGGQLVIDCQGIMGQDSIALTPKGRYARAKGIWFLPTESCLVNWVRRAGFRNIEVFFNEKLSLQEQRRSEWADIDSLSEFLDPENPEKTIEGYPAPRRFYLKALK